MSAETTLNLDEEVAIEVFGGLIFKDGIHGADAPPYSTSIEAAWEVVDEMERQGHSPILARIKVEDDWQAAFGTRASHYGKTAPEAICRAALATVRLKNERP